VRALVQRVSRARVLVDDEEVGAIGAGLCAFVGVTHDDTSDHARKLAGKIWNLRVFEDDAGAMRDLGAAVVTGRFRTHMQVELVNDGRPATLLLEV
jgi:D-aminoacyl-tRNA deacylase